jgi:cyanophycinase
VLEDATGIFLTGGNQLRLSSIVTGTALGKAILEANLRGAVVGGTSAGASAASTLMMAFGSSGEIPKHRMAQLSAGLGLLPNIIVDQHFEQRGRIGRLISAVAQSPSMLGIGVDEDTAAIVSSNGTLEVIGRGVVTIVDGANMVTDSYMTKGHRPMMVSGAVLHSLPTGYRFDLTARELIPVIDSTTQRAARAKRVATKRMAQLAREMAAEGANSFVVDRPRRRPAAEREASE